MVRSLFDPSAEADVLHKGGRGEMRPALIDGNIHHLYPSATPRWDSVAPSCFAAHLPGGGVRGRGRHIPSHPPGVNVSLRRARGIGASANPA